LINLSIGFNIFKKDKDLFKAFDNFDVLPRLPNVLLGFFVGENAKKIENLDEECLIDLIYELFNKCFPKSKLPKPIKIIKLLFYYSNSLFTY
jgi:hypothetical protein